MPETPRLVVEAEVSTNVVVETKLVPLKLIGWPLVKEVAFVPPFAMPSVPLNELSVRQEFWNEKQPAAMLMP